MSGFNIYSMFVAVIGAIIVLFIYHAIVGRTNDLDSTGISRAAAPQRGGFVLGGDYMSLLDSVLGGLLGGNPNAGPLQSVLGSILGGSQANARQRGQPGLVGLVNTFEHAGLGNVVSSWIGTGQNQPVNPSSCSSVRPGSRSTNGRSKPACRRTTCCPSSRSFCRTPSTA